MKGLIERQATYWALVVMLLWSAFGIRVYRLDAVDLRGDEAYTAVYWVTRPFTDAWWNLIGHDPAPAGVFIFYWGWARLVGNTPFTLRYASALSGLIGAAAMYALAARVLQSRRLAFFAAILWATHPFLIWNAQDARSYSLLSTLTVLGFYGFWRGLASTESRFWRRWGGYIAPMALSFHLHFMQPVWLAAQMGYVALERRDQLRAIWKAWAVLIVVMLPVAAQLYAVWFINDFQGSSISGDAGVIFREFWPRLLIGAERWPTWAGVMIAGVLLVGLLKRRDALLIGWVYLPLLLVLGFSVFTSPFRVWHIIGTLPGMLLALLALAQRVRWRGAPLLTISALALLFVVSATVEVTAYFFIDPPKAPEWRSITAALAEHTTSADVIISDAADPALTYYYTGAAEILYLPYAVPPAATFAPDLLTRYESVYLLTGERTGELDRYLHEQAQRIAGEIWPGVRHFRRWEMFPAEIDHPLEVEFGDLARLRGYTRIGGTTVLLYWEALRQTAGDHQILFHVQADHAPPVYVSDHGLADSMVSTREWTPGVIYRDPVALPPDLLPGQYTVYVGWYTLPDGIRLSVSVPSADSRYALFVLP